MREFCGLLLAYGLTTGCGGGPGPRPLHYELGTCGTVDILETLDPGIHVPQGTAIEWSTNPPTSGEHFPTWASWDRSYTDLERGFWVHNLEHGAIVLLYRCDDGCPDEVAQLEDVVRAMPDDPTCVAPNRSRSIVVADPLLPGDRMFAAVAWGVMYTASCVDPAAILELRRDFARSAPEDTCASGASIGGTRIE